MLYCALCCYNLSKREFNCNLRMIKKKIKSILVKISRLIYLMIPLEYKSNLTLQTKINDNLVEETFNNFKEHFKKA